ncbi:hypothetical protein CRUP_012968 [Coryphaenoides rupestris]|nr:hypothetical protein CRUP_012968 [Coryphaenoides rupestris]
MAANFEHIFQDFLLKKIREMEEQQGDGGGPAWSVAEVLLCQGVVQAVVGVARSRVVCSSRSTAISTLQLFVLSEDGSYLVGLCVQGALFVLLQHQYLGSIAPEEAHQSHHQGDQRGGDNNHKNNNNDDVVSVETERENKRPPPPPPDLRHLKTAV